LSALPSAATVPEAVCPRCRSDVIVGDLIIRCISCAATYDVVDSIPVMLAAGEQTSQSSQQSAFFDEEVDSEFEIERPYNTPDFYRWLLEEKFRRVARLPLLGRTVLVVCGGSGMDAEFLAREGAVVASTDISLGAAQRTRERARRHQIDVVPLVADVEQLPFPDLAFDLVYVHDGLHHLVDPLCGLAEMARVSAHGLCITEPAAASLTAGAVKLGLALDREEAGNAVARLQPRQVVAALEREGFKTTQVERYAMRYRHEPGSIVRTLSLPGVLPLARMGMRAVDATLARGGNKLAVVAVRR
jgi:SAM-dependent methyltransferase